ncbi:hypothetical protein M7I_0780 [Glarea lozoyensis 74030]|nr:hypothetical protein M7I_0780 [Glarea lozoyensis 74030]
MVKMSGFISTIVSSENATAELDQVFAEAQTLSGDLLAQKNILSLAADPSAGTKVFDHNSEATAGLKVVLSIIEQELQTVARNVDSVTVQFPILTGQWNITEVPDVICLVQDAIEKQGIPGGDVELFTLHSETFAVSAKGPNSNGIPLLQSHVTIT